jgi:hypothetical protein
MSGLPYTKNYCDKDECAKVRSEKRYAPIKRFAEGVLTKEELDRQGELIMEQMKNPNQPFYDWHEHNVRVNKQINELSETEK